MTLDQARRMAGRITRLRWHLEHLTIGLIVGGALVLLAIAALHLLTGRLG